MNCKHWKPVLFDLARGLESDQTSEAQLHVKECTECSAVLKNQQNLTQILKTVTSETRGDYSTQISPELRVAFRNARAASRVRDVFMVTARVAILTFAIIAGWVWYRSYSVPQAISNGSLQLTDESEEFIPLQYADHPVNSWQVVRVELESSALQQLGFPRLPEWENYPIQADIVVSEDGLPQAIRFVNYSPPSHGGR